MNIAIIAHAYLPELGGTQEVIRGLSKSLQAKSHNVIVIAFSMRETSRPPEVIDGVRVFWLRVPFLILPPRGAKGFLKVFSLFFLLPAALIRLQKIFKENNIQVINVHFTGVNAFCVWLLSYFTGLKYILTLHGFNLQALAFLKGAYYSIVSLIYRMILNRAIFISACSKALLEDAIARVPSIKGKSGVISNGINLEEFERNGAPLVNYPYILSLGRLQSPFKGLDVLLFALKRLCEQGIDTRLVIAGEGVDRLNYQKLCELLNLKDNVYFFGKANREEAVNLFKNCEFFVMPSRIEPFGIVNLEAMAAGKAVLATKTGGIPEVVDNGVNGLLVAPCNDEALAIGIEKLLKDKQLRNRLGENGRKKIEEQGFSWAITADKYLGMYKSALGLKSISFDPLEVVKIKNREAGLRDFNSLNEVCCADPFLITVSDTAGCNISCIMCFRNGDHSGQELRAMLKSPRLKKILLTPWRNHKKDSVMDFNLFKKLADETFTKTSVLTLSLAGEPFTSPNFERILDVAEAKKVKLVIFTNATLIPKGKLLTKLVNNLALLVVSIDAARKKTYESIRRGAKFDRVIDNIRRFNLERNKILTNRPELIFRAVLMRRNIEELADYVRLAMSLEVDGIGACHANIFRKDLENESLVFHKELANRYLKQAKELIEFFGLSIYDFPPLFSGSQAGSNQPKQEDSRPCIYPWREIFIEANGDVYPCCAPDRKGLLMGNINESSLRDIWNNDRYRKLRCAFKNNNLLVACRNCYLRKKSLAPDDESLYLRFK